MFKIVADSAIPFVERCFSPLGEIQLVDGREISTATLDDADVLVCRTVTRVDERLLANTHLRIVASATSGIDHVDTAFLEDNAIGFVHAPGCNARSVAEYVLSALCVLADRDGLALEDKRVGLVGCGHVGACLKDLLEVMGIDCCACDPLLARTAEGGTYCDLEQVQDCDIISLHVPLTVEGEHPTRHMIDAGFLQALRSDTLLINTSRGDVVDEAALKQHVQDNPDFMLVMDVWKNEPAIDLELLSRVDIATPHIAGYSMDARFRATRDVYIQVCQYLDVQAKTGALGMAENSGQQRSLRLNTGQPDIAAISLAILASYDVRSDAAAVRRLLENDVPDPAAYFAELRNNYPVRREFPALLIEPDGEDSTLVRKLATLGFQVAGSTGR